MYGEFSSTCSVEQNGKKAKGEDLSSVLSNGESPATSQAFIVLTARKSMRHQYLRCFLLLFDERIWIFPFSAINIST